MENQLQDKMFRSGVPQNNSVWMNNTPPPVKAISSFGSADPENGKLQSAMQTFNPEQIADYKEKLKSTPMNPLMEDFTKLFSNPQMRDNFATNPAMQSKFFDVDNFIKSNAGITREKQDGMQEFGVDTDGQTLYANPDSFGKDFDLGKNKLYSTGTILQQLGAFDDDEEAGQWAKYTDLAGNPAFLGHVNALAANGDKKGAVNTLLGEFGLGSIEDLDKNPNDERKMGMAFAAHSLVGNIDKMSPTQQSLAMSGMAIAAFQFKTGDSIGKKALINDDEGNPQLTVGNALAMAGAGKDVFGLMKNYDQIDAIQRLTFGKGGSGQMMTTADRMGLVGDPAMGDSSVQIKPSELGKMGFSSVPSAGIGAITGPGDSLPKDYEVVGSGANPGQVIAVPKGLSEWSATINGSSKITSLNQSDGIEPAGPGAFKTQAGWLKTGQDLSVPHGSTGTPFAAGLVKSGITKDPYLASSLAATSIYGNTVSNKAPPTTSPLQAIEQSGTSAQKSQVNIRQMTRSDPKLNTTIQATQSIVNTMAKNGNSTAASSATYVNAVAAGKRLYDVMQDPNASSKDKAEAVAGAAQTGVNLSATSTNAAGSAAPYINGAMAAYNASKIISSDMTDKQKAVALRKTAEDTAAAYFTFGLSAVGQWVDRQFLGGQSDKLRNKIDKIDPGIKLGDKLMEKVIGGFGGKDKDRLGRDQIRKLSETSGFSTDYKLTLASGNTVDIGLDRKDGEHEFRFTNKVLGDGDVRSLAAYDVDYTNDLDAASNHMTNAFARLLAGGKATAVDQFGGQLANAALSDVGFGQDMTEGNFKKVQANARGFFNKQGIKSKEDAYALANQMFAEQRLTEADTIGMQQGINMVFDDDGFDTAQTLMAGRWKGMEVAADLPKSPGPNFDLGVKAPAPGQNIDPGFTMPTQEAEADPETEWSFKPGTYGGNANTGIFAKAVNNYKDPWIQKLNQQKQA